MGSNFDTKISLRTIVLSAAIGYFTKVFPSPEIGALVYGILGGVYDLLAFLAKDKLMKK